jgi:hypothetical protein
MSTAKLIFADHIAIHHWAKALNLFVCFTKHKQCEHKSPYVNTVSNVIQLWIIMPLTWKDNSTFPGPIKSCVSPTNDTCINLLCRYTQKSWDSSGYRGDSWRLNSAFDGELFFSSSIQIVYKTSYKYFMNLLIKIMFSVCGEYLCSYWSTVGLKVEDVTML